MAASSSEQPSQATAAKIQTAMERLTTFYRGRLQEQAKQTALTPLQLQILLFLEGHPARLCNVTQLATEFAVSKPTISDAVKTLIKKDLVKKSQDRRDGRAFFIELSKQGRLKLQEPFEGEHFLVNALSDSPTEDLEKIYQGLILLLQTLRGQHNFPIRMCFACSHFQRHRDSETPFYCHLLAEPLTLTDLRMDCPEFVEEVTS